MRLKDVAGSGPGAFWVVLSDSDSNSERNGAGYVKEWGQMLESAFRDVCSA